MDAQKAREYNRGERGCPYCDTDKLPITIDTDEDYETLTITRECPDCEMRWLEVFDFAGITADITGSDKDETFYRWS